MFHCNGWCFPWTMAANAGVNVCLRKVDPALIFEMIRRYKVTHMWCADCLRHDDQCQRSAPQGHRAQGERPHRRRQPPAAIIEGAERMGFDITHVYGLTETYGPASVCANIRPGMNCRSTNGQSATVVRVCAITCRKRSPCSIP